MQDLFAVIFLTASKGTLPSPWALLLLLLPLVRPGMLWLMSRAGHGELLIMWGFLLTVAGAELFELVRLKADLGALILGMLLASFPPAGGADHLGDHDLHRVHKEMRKRIGRRGRPAVDIALKRRVFRPEP